MNRCIVNGKFMADSMMGIVRYSREILQELDRILDSGMDVVLAVPPDAKDIPEYQNIRVESIGKHTGILWEQTDLRRYIRKYPDALCINTCNAAPFFVQPGITVVHDIMYQVNPSDYTTPRNRLSRLWHVLQYRYLMRHERVIVTVSAFSKADIERYYPSARGKIVIIPNAWQHVNSYQESVDWQSRYSYLQDKNYYFSLASRAKNKNGAWIFNAAKRNPDSVFAVAGKAYESEGTDFPANVHMLGYVTDNDVCALIRHCKAFVFPSLYEGFGLPPLEALALGAKVIASNAASLPEVLGNSVYYIDPHNADVNLEQIMKQPVEPADKILDQYNWRHSAELLLNVMKGQ